MNEEVRIIRSAQPDRDIRVFVSSTFVDMQEERDLLARVVFPRLKARCASLGVGFSGIDLRWGVPPERVQRGEVVDICLRSVTDCRAFFIALLGQRYGWSPPGERRSLTQMEIERGLLSDAPENVQAFVYVRDPAYLKTLSAADRKAFCEGYFKRRRVTRLVKRLAEKGFEPRPYARPQEVAERIEEDLWQAIRALFDENEASRRSALRHRAFRERASRLHVVDEKLFEQLDRCGMGKTGPLAVVGEPGTGKSSLAAAWATDFAKRNPGIPTFSFHAEALAAGADPELLVRDAADTLELAYKLQLPPDEGAGDEFDRFFACLNGAADKGPLVVVLDGLEHLDHARYSSALSWVPRHLPEGVRLVATCEPKWLEELAVRSWQIEKMRAPEGARLEALVAERLALVGKEPEPELLGALRKSPVAASPRFLAAFLDELAIVGKHETLAADMRRLLGAGSLAGLYGEVIDRLLRDYGDRRQVVLDLLGFLAATESGLTETELLELAGVQMVDWLPVYVALEGAWHRDTGRLAVLSADLEAAVRETLAKEGAENSDPLLEHRTRILEYMGQCRDEERRLEEIPRQLVRLNQFRKLGLLLQELDEAVTLASTDLVMLHRYWAQVEEHTEMRLADAFVGVCEEPERLPDRTVLFLLIMLKGHPASTLPLARYYARRLDDLPMAPGARCEGLMLCAGTLHRAGESLAALELISGPDFDAGNLTAGEAGSAAERRGLIRLSLGQLDEGLRELEEAEKLWEEAGSRVGVLSTLGNRIGALLQRGRFEEAQELMQRRAGGAGFAGDAIFRGQMLAQKGMLVRKNGDAEQALRLYSEAVDLFRYQAPRFYRSAIQSTGLALMDLRKYDEAETRLGEARELARKAGDLELEAACSGDLGLLFARQKKQDEAERELKRQIAVAGKIGARDQLARAYANLSGVYRRSFRDDEADEAQRQAEHYNEDAQVLYKGGALGAIGRILEETMNAKKNPVARFQEAYNLQSSGRIDDAIAIYEELIEESRAAGIREILKISLGNLADLRLGRGEHQQADPLYAELVQVSGELGDLNMARNAWQNLLVITYRDGEMQKLTSRLLQMMKWGVDHKDRETVNMARERLGALGIKATPVDEL